MDLLLEARKGNKEAFKELTEDIEIKLYKTARYYFTNEEEILYVMQISLKHLFKEIINVKKYEQLLPLGMRFLIKTCEEVRLKKSRNKKWIAYISSEKSKAEYARYREESFLEQCITSLNKEYRLISILYFYADLDIYDIATILKMSSKDLEELIDKARESLYQIISNEGVKKYNEYV